MTSLFEDLSPCELYVPTASPEDLMGPGKRGIALLEFFAVDQLPSEQFEDAPQEQRASANDAGAQEGAIQARIVMDAALREAALEMKRSMEVELRLEVAKEQLRVEGLCGEFARDRQRYFAAAETQVVKLALAIARRVLAREVAADPMHLSLIVKAALARVQDGSKALLRVSLGEVEEWHALFLRDELHVQIIGEGQIMPGGCLLETSVGHVDLAVSTQMNEIERGFEELMQRQGE